MKIVKKFSSAMIRKRIFALILVSLSTVVFDAQAKTIVLRGMSSCGQWTQESKINGNGSPDASSTFWLLGYLSGLAMMSETNFIVGTDTDSLKAWVTNYCQNNPLNYLSDAGDKLFFELKRRKGL